MPPLSEKKVDLLLSGHVLGMFPRDEDSVGGNRIPNTDVRGTIGARIKSVYLKGKMMASTRTIGTG